MTTILVLDYNKRQWKIQVWASYIRDTDNIHENKTIQFEKKKRFCLNKSKTKHQSTVKLGAQTKLLLA